MTRSFLSGCVVLCALAGLLASPVSARDVTAATDPASSAGGFGYTIEAQSPFTQSTPDLFVGVYYNFLLTNTSNQTDTFRLVIDNLSNPGWFGQVCINAICFPDSTTITLGPGMSNVVGANIAPFSDGVTDADFHVTSVGDPGLTSDYTVTLYAGTGAVGVEEIANTAGLILHQSSPNPMRDATSLSFALPQAGPVTLRVFDVMGRTVRTLIDGTQAAGTHGVRWDGSDDGGRRLANGVYFYRLDSTEGSRTKTLTLVR